MLDAAELLNVHVRSVGADDGDQMPSVEPAGFFDLYRALRVGVLQREAALDLALPDLAGFEGRGVQRVPDRVGHGPLRERLEVPFELPEVFEVDREHLPLSSAS